MPAKIMLLIAAAAPLFGQVNLSGIVTDTAGTPVAAAAVRLEAGGLTATTGADGRFALTGNTGIGAALPQTAFAAVHNGALLLSLAEKATVTVTAHGLEGRTLFSHERRLEAGSHSLSLPNTGSGIRFFKVRAGARETLVKAFSLQGALRGAPMGSREYPAGQSLAKRTTAAPLYDVISAAKTGFLKSYVSISNSDSSNIRIKLLGQNTPKFSFFVTSLKAMTDLGGAKGFGGDLRFGETGAGAGLRGADKICATVADRSMPNSSFKGWRAFLSVSSDPAGKQANAIDRIGEGPWYDRLGRTLAAKKADLLAASGRPSSADPAIATDFPNEDGVPNEKPDATKPAVDNHHFLTGSDTQGKLYGANATCNSWTTAATTAGRPRIGFSFTAGGRVNWISGQDEGGCGAGINLAETGGSDPNNPIVGSGGGYGGIYCFALNP